MTAVNLGYVLIPEEGKKKIDRDRKMGYYISPKYSLISAVCIFNVSF